MKRRTFFEQLIKSVAIMGVSAITIAGIFPALFSKKRKTQKLVLGKQDDVFSDTQFVTENIGDVMLIIKKDSQDNITAFDASCTHAGCPVQWTELEQKFLCKCHGGIFDSNGNPIAGPPTKPLKKYKVIKRNQTQEIIIYLDDKQT
jgi:Rieske Fe-S protein